MKQSTLSPAAAAALFDDDEVEVCNILLDLKYLILQSAEFQGFEYCWGRKRRRSDRGYSRLVSPTTTSRDGVNSQSPPPPKDEFEIPARPKVKSEVLSPATPLSFSPSESDEKPINSSSRKLSKKRTREEWMRDLDELTQCRELLIGQLENVRVYYNKQKAYNLKLKAIKQELLGSSQKREEPTMSVIGPDPNITQAQQYHQYQQPIIFGPLGQRFHYQFVQKDRRQALLSSQNGLGLVNYRVGPIGIPDLNVSVEETMGAMVVGPSQPFDLLRMDGDKKARYAEARKSRMIKNKLKIKSGSRLLSVPCRR